MVQEAAYQRKNRVLADSSKRLSSLSKVEYDDDDTPPDPPTSIIREMALTPTERKPEVAKPAERLISPLDRKGTQRIAICNLISYVISMICGSFVCHILHGHKVDGYCPKILLFIFSLLKAFGAGHFVSGLVKAWENTPAPMRATVVNVLTYGSVLINVYPMYSALTKQTTTPKPGETEDGATPAANAEGQAGQDDGNAPAAQNELDEKHLVMIATFVIRSCAACLVFGLLGYDVLYNAHLAKVFLHKAMKMHALLE